MQLGRGNHSSFQPAFVQESQQLFAEKNVRGRRRFWQRPQCPFNNRHALTGRHFPRTRQPRGPGIGRRGLGGTFNGGFQDDINLWLSSSLNKPKCDRKGLKFLSFRGILVQLSRTFPEFAACFRVFFAFD